MEQNFWKTIKRRSVKKCDSSQIL